MKRPDLEVMRLKNLCSELGVDDGSNEEEILINFINKIKEGFQSGNGMIDAVKYLLTCDDSEKEELKRVLFYVYAHDLLISKSKKKAILNAKNSFGEDLCGIWKYICDFVMVEGD